MDPFPNWDVFKEGDRVSLVGTPLIMDNRGDHLFRTLEAPCKEVVIRGILPVEHGTIAFVGLVIKTLKPVTICCVDDVSGIYPIFPCQMADIFRIVELCSGMGAFSSIAEHCGFKVCAGVDHNDKWRTLFNECHKEATFIHGDCADFSTMKKLHEMNASHSMVMAGIACQPHSKGGDQLGMSDQRSSSLPKALRMSWMLQSPITILECVPDVLNNRDFQRMLEEYCAATGTHLTQQVLRLSNFWPAKRDRWFACISAGILGPIRVPDLPMCSAFSKVEQVVPYLQAWPQTDMDQLLLSEFEEQKFRLYSKGGIEQRFIDFQGVLPTCLHSAGNQVLACKCGCRGPLSDWRLKERGLFGTLVPVETNHDSSVRFRYMHPKEMYILNGGNPMMHFEDMRLSLGAVGQCVSPFHGIWMLSHVASHLAAFLQHEQVDPHYCIHTYTKWLLDQRDLCWPPMPVDSLIPSDVVKCLWVGSKEECSSTPQDMDIVIGDDSTQSVIAFKVTSGVTVQQFVDAQSALEGTPISWPVLIHGGKLASEDCDISICDLTIPGPKVSSEQSFLPCPCEEWSEISPTLPINLAPVFEQSCVAVDALLKLQGEEFLQMIGPQVSNDSVDALTDARISHDDRQTVLANQGSIWADDELRVFLKQMVDKGSDNQHMVFWDPLLLSSVVATGNLSLLHPHIQALGSTCTVITVVLVEKHWFPLVWKIDPYNVLGYTCGLAFNFSVALQKIHNEISQLRNFPPSMLVNRHLDFVVSTGCGAMAVAFIEHLLWSQELPKDQNAVLAKHAAFRAMFRSQLSMPATRPWIWGAGDDDVKHKLVSLLKDHGVAFSDCVERVQMLITKLGAPALEKALRASEPWKELKWLANKQTPVIQIVRPSELQAMIDARSKSGKNLGNRAQKQGKAKGKGKGQQQESCQVDPTKIRLEKGIFVCGEGIMLPQIDVNQVGAQASGVVVCSASVAAPYLRGNRQISTGGLAFVVLAQQAAIPPTMLISEQVRIPVLCAATAEPLLVDAFLFQLGAIPVRRYLSDNRFELTSIASCVAKIAVYRDQIDRDWETFTVHPLRHIFSKIPILAPCEDETCGGSCEGWHKTSACSIDSPILEMWGKQWMLLNFTATTPEKSQVFTVHIRLPMCIQQQLQGYSGGDGVYIEPKALDGRKPSEVFHVIWMAKSTVQELTLLKQTQSQICGLARMGHKVGIRCLAIHAAEVYAMVKPGNAFLPQGKKRFWLMGPLPYGVLKGSISEALQTISWVARPVSPVATPPHIEGVMWKIQSVEAPQRTVLQMAHGEVVITAMDQKHDFQAPVAQVVGAERTVQLCSTRDEGGVDTIFTNDPWAQSLKSTKAPDVKMDHQDPIEQIEKRVVQAVLAKMPPSMEVDSVPVSSEVDQRIHALESRVHQLSDGHQRLHQAMQEQTAAQVRLEARVGEGAEQLQSFQTQFRAQLEQQQGQLDSLFQQQMSKIEEILKRPRTH